LTETRKNDPYRLVVFLTLINFLPMKQLILLHIFFACSLLSFTQTRPYDFRDRQNGRPIFQNGYIDQPYVVVLDSGEWLCVFTTAKGIEGSRGQHIASTLSNDQGKTWSEPVRIEEPTSESASWAMPYKTRYGRIYVFYDYNGDKIHRLNNQENIREDILGWYCFKYSDDKGKTWSKRYRLPINVTAVDRQNDWGGKVHIMWGIGKPINVGKNSMLFAFTKIGKYMLDNSEGWFMRCDNIHTERDPEKLKWKNLPEGDHGVRNPALGSVQEEQNIVELSNGTLYCMYRTITGYAAETYSFDQGKTWTMPQLATYYTGNPIKNPRACPRIFKTQNGNYLFWHHANSGRDFGIRNPAWISGGIEKNGKIVWSQPEILVYAPGLEKERMSYPDLIEQDGRYWITETNKEQAMCHEVDKQFFQNLWNQFQAKTLATKELVINDTGDAIIGKQYTLPKAIEPAKDEGFTIDLVADITRLRQGEIILQSSDSSGRKVKLEMGPNYALTFSMSDGAKTTSWSSDGGVIQFHGTSKISVIVDFRAKIISYVINGIFNDGGKERMYGWGRLDATMGPVSSDKLKIGTIRTGGEHREKNKIQTFRFYDRPLTVSECVGNQRG
jgi:hypothetical protein